MYQFDSVFISHRSFDYPKALKLEQFLIDNHISKKVVLLKNETLCKNYEQLTVHEYFEAIEKIKREMEKCNFFFFIFSENYENGYFTSAEILQWRRIKDNPVIYPIVIDEGTFRYIKPITLSPLTKGERKRMSFTAYMMRDDYEYGGATESWGKYAHECFLVGCCSCGKYYLITEKRINRYIASQEIAECPYCHTAHAAFTQCKNGRKYFNNRYPIIMQPRIRRISDLQQLEVADVIDLLNTNKLPERFLIDNIPGEKLKSDFKKEINRTVQTMGLMATIMATGIALYELFKKDED